MIVRMLRRDLSRGRVAAATLLLFILLSAALTAAGLRVTAELSGAMDTLFRQAGAPHFVQMHAGEIDQAAIDTFVNAQPMVTGQQTVEMLNVAGAQIYLGSDLSKAGSVMENAFVVQNGLFDFLLDLDGEVFRPAPGEIGVPVYHMQQSGLRVGDTVRVAGHGFEKEWAVAAFVRDVQMNPSVVTSKRFVTHPDDWAELKAAGLAESEYLIEFLLDDPANADAFEQLYQASGLPQKDTAITWSLYRLLSALTDGIVIGVVILIALLLMSIALLCLRFTILAGMEEDLREIGVMKAIGLPMRSIRGLYLAKYTLLAGVACVAGVAVSIPLGGVLSGNIALYMGRSEPTAAHRLLPAAGALAVFLLVQGFCLLLLRRIRRVSAVDALRAGSGGGKGPRKRLALHRLRLPEINVLLGARDVFCRPRQYAVLCLVFALCVFLMVLPLNLLTTMESPRFISYMGAGRSDIRMDLARTSSSQQEYSRIQQKLQQDPDIGRFAALVTAAYRVESDGKFESLKVETGDLHVFPLEYLEGEAPAGEGEIALSAMQAGELEAQVGDSLTLLVQGEPHKLRVCGIYQDVTNGGKTAKAKLPWREQDVLWYVVNLDVAPGVDREAKIAALEAEFPSARVLDMEEYLSQTMGGTIGQLRLAARVAFAVALTVAVCITTLFFRMLLAKDRREIAILRALGFSSRDIELQYAARALLVLLAGVLLGTLAVNTLGQGLAGALGSLIGASRIRFAVNPWLAWLLYPLCLLAAVTTTTAISGSSLRRRPDLRCMVE